MSWKGIQKAVVRMPQMVKQKTGFADTTHDVEFDQLAEEFERGFRGVKVLVDDLKTYRQAMQSWIKHQIQLSDDETLLERIMQETEKDCEETIDANILAKVTEYADMLKNVSGKITKRNHKLIDYDRHRNTVRSLSQIKNRSVSEERNMIRAEEAFQQAQAEYELHNRTLKEELPVLMQCQANLIRPIYAQLLALQKRFFERLRTYNGDLVKARTRPSEIEHGFTEAVQQYYELLSECKMTRIGGLGKLSHSTSSSSLKSDFSSPAHPQINKPLPIPNNLRTKGSIESLVEKMQLTEKAAHSINNAGTNSQNNTTTASSNITNGMGNGKTICTATNSNSNKVTALYDFTAQQAGDLSFKAGDTITVTEKTEHVNDWWRGRTLDGREGMFPGNYVK